MSSRPDIRVAPHLDREQIIAAALALLDEVGLRQLSTRRLADRLGVRSPALYWHFSNKRELVDAMADAMLDAASWPGPWTPGAGPADWLAERHRALRRALLGHRDGALVHSGTRPSADGLPALEAQVTALVQAGLSPENALRTILVVSRYTVGWVLEEQADSAQGEQRMADETEYRDTPTLAQARAVVEQRDPDADFEFGLQSIIAGALARAGLTEMAAARIDGSATPAPG